MSTINIEKFQKFTSKLIQLPLFLPNNDIVGAYSLCIAMNSKIIAKKGYSDARAKLKELNKN